MHTLILVRHGQSTWNQENRFTGWIDVDLSPRGEQEALAAGRLLAAEPDIKIDVLHTSVLTRAVRTANLALDEMGRAWVPIRKHWRLNERHYGALQGLGKKDAAERFGAEQVKKWRRSYDVPPPPLAADDPLRPSNDPRYAGLAPEVLPTSECLADVVGRLLPYWQDTIVSDLKAGLTVCVVAHGNSLRALVKHLEHISDTDVVSLDIPTGIPRVYKLSRTNLEVLEVRYLGDPSAVAAATSEVAGQAG